MKRNRKEGKRRRQTIQVWTYEQARAALPYLASIVGSLREHRLDWQFQQHQARQLANRSGRPDRKTMIGRQEVLQAAEQAQERFQAALDELHALDIYCLDPLRGEAVIPFVQAEQLAWFVYDLFDEQPLRFWRYHTDALEMRRPIAEVLDGPKEETAIV
jgi:hypothetical protein